MSQVPDGDPADGAVAVSTWLLPRLVGVAIGLAKRALHTAQHATLEQAMTQELYGLELSCRTADFKEGLAAFRERGTPEFNGR